MKHLKLFENFTEENTLSVEGILKRKEYANDVIEDIKTISYLLEEEGFELKYQFAIPYGDGLVNYFEIEDYNRWTNGNMSGENLETIMIDSIVVKVIGNTINKLKSVKRYINLLREHLDYINPHNISKGRSLMGNINIIIKLPFHTF